MDDRHDVETGGDSPEARFGAALRSIRVQAGLSVRLLAKELDRAHSTISDFENGRRLPGVEVVEQYEDYFGLARGTLGAERERARAQRLESPRDGTVAENLGDVVCPYKGLLAFEHQDAALFFGRETQIEGVLASLTASRLVAVIGASGSGKSSFVRAGLLARINTPTTDGATSPRVALLTPGEHPLDELASALSAATGSSVPVRSDDLRVDPDALQRAIRRADDGALVIVVDQFEELFTRCRDELEQRFFVDALIAAWRDPSSPVVVIVALRADFYGRIAAYPQLAAAVVAHQTLIGPMSPGDLRRAIELPAAKTGLLLQPGLVDTILEDLAGEPGSLPLLSHALLETWKRRRRLMLTLSGYREAGGVRGAIAQTAERTLQALPEADQAIARSIFLSLTDVDEGAEPTGRRVDRAELAARPRSAERLDRVLEILTDARLLTIDEQTVGVAHEALIGHWPRLCGWIEADRAGLIIHRRLTDAARDWDKLKREPAALYRGARLATASEWATEHPDHLSALERDFLTASQAAEQRRTRRRRGLLTGLATVTAIIALLAVAALEQRNNARGQAQKARQQVLEATSLALSTAGLSLLRSRPDVSLLLALEANRASPKPEARSSALAALIAARDPGILAILHGHSAGVSSVAISPDGRTLASASDDRTILLWDVRTHKQIGRPLTGHTSGVRSVAFSRDGRTLASGSWDTTVRLWHVPSGKQLGAPLRGHTSAVTDVAFGRDGRMLASASEDNTLRLWDVRTTKQLGAPLRGHTSGVFGVAFSPDGRMLASASDDRTLRLWDVRTTKQLGPSLRGHTVAVFSVAFSPDGRTLASGSEDIRLWDVRTTAQLGAPLRGHTGGVFGVAFSRDGRTLASASADRTVRSWNVRTHNQIGRPLTGHSDNVRSVAFSRDGSTLATASFDETVRLWNVRIRTSLRAQLTGHTRPVENVAFTPDGRTLASASTDNTVRLWNVRTRTPLGRPLRGHTDRVRSVVFSRDGRTLASAGADKTVRLWNVRTHKQLGVAALALADAVREGRLWSARIRKQEGVSIIDRFVSVAFSPDGRTLAAGREDGTIWLWDAHNANQLGAPLTGHTNRVNSVAFSSDRQTLASASDDLTVRVWDARTHKQLGAPLTGQTSFSSVAFSPDGHTLAFGDFDGTLWLWDARTTLGAALIGHDDPVNSVAFSSDRRTLASASHDGTVRVWDVRTHKQLGPSLRGHGDDRLDSVAFSPDGRTLTASDGKTIRLWEKIFWRSFGDLQTQVCNLVGTGLSKTEWAQYAPGIPYRQSCP